MKNKKKPSKEREATHKAAKSSDVESKSLINDIFKFSKPPKAEHSGTESKGEIKKSKSIISRPIDKQIDKKRSIRPRDLDEDLGLSGNSRRYTEDGLAIYTENDLKLGMTTKYDNMMHIVILCIT